MYENAQTAAKPEQSLMSDHARLTDRLHEIRHRLEKLADSIHGPVPRSAEAKGQGPAPEPMPTIRRYTDKSHEACTGIEVELNRIENQL